MNRYLINPLIGDLVRVVAILLWSLIGFASPAPAQNGFDPPIRRVVVPEGVELDGRVPLLREGGILQKAAGRIERDESIGVYVFHPEIPEGSSERRELILLPSRGLEDLVRIEKVSGPTSSPALADRDFEVSGRVLVYRGRNFLLPEAIVPQFRLDPPSERSSRVPDPPVADGPEGEDDLADRLERRLEERIGAVPRSLDFKEAEPVVEAQIEAGTRFVDRRGRISRDPASGVWRFILAGDGSGADVPSVILLPCLELERLERLVREADVRSDVLLSGRISTFQGRVYLLPTLARAAREGRGIGP